MNKIEYCQKHIDYTNQFIEETKINTLKINEYICPICLKYFSINDKKLTDEHVPQYSLGGCRTTVTCDDCNKNAGKEIDIYLINYLKQRNFNNKCPVSEIELGLKTKHGGGKIILFNDENGQHKIKYPKEHDGTKRMDWDFQNAWLKKVYDMGEINTNLHPTMHYTPIEKLSEIKLDSFVLKKIIVNDGKNDNYLALLGILKNSYLLLFHEYSYTIFFYYPILKTIQEMITNPKEKFDVNFYVFMNINYNCGIQIIESPIELKECIIVTLPYTITYNKDIKITTNITTIFPPHNKKIEITKSFECKSILLKNYISS